MRSKKMNSYIKMGVAMAVGGVIGGILAIFFTSFNERIEDILKNTYLLISDSLFVILTALAITVLLICGLSYGIAERIIKKINTCEEEEKEIYDYKYEIWSAVSMVGSTSFLLLGMILLGFLPFSEAGAEQIVSIIPFLALAIICAFFQIAAVKQMQRLDPTKKGDPADLKFQKEMLESCDEAEKELIYQASYRTFSVLKNVLLVGVLFALFGQIFWKIGVAPVVFVGSIYILMAVTYSIYSLKLQKSRLNV